MIYVYRELTNGNTCSTITNVLIDYTFKATILSPIVFAIYVSLWLRILHCRDINVSTSYM